jgi:hypothetical protein
VRRLTLTSLALASDAESADEEAMIIIADMMSLRVVDGFNISIS